MASIDAALIAALTAAPTVSALAGTRVFVAGARQGSTYPYVTVQRISTQGAGHLGGPSNLDWPRFQIDVWGTTALSALDLAEAIRVAIDGVTTTAGGYSFSATLQDQRGPSPDEETRNFGVSQDYYIWHSR
jgi:hypothetical protein